LASAVALALVDSDVPLASAIGQEVLSCAVDHAAVVGVLASVPRRKPMMETSDGVVALDGVDGEWDVSSFDFMHPQMRIDPYPTFKVMRERAPIHWDGMAHWMFRYEDARAVLLGDQFGRVASAFQRQYFDTLGAGQPYEYVIRRMTYLDQIDHTRVRGLFASTFTPRRIEGLRPYIIDMVNGLLDRIDPTQPFDILDAVAHPLPSLVICEMLGVPQADRELFDGWTQRIAHLVSPAITEAQYADAAAALAGEWELMEQLVIDRSADLGDDLLSDLITASRGEATAISHEELVSNCIFLFSAGHQTTRDTVGNGLFAMLRDRGQYASLAADPVALAPVATEEALRFDAPVVQSWEVALSDTEVGGVTIREGEAVFPLLGACNHDPKRFDEPDRFRIDRPNNVPVTFSLGPHHCMGSALARMEVSILLQAIAERYPTLELVSDQLEWRDTVVFRGPVRLDVTAG
jgi:pimeloyl-[acyl-carrier protein] synthase